MPTRFQVRVEPVWRPLLLVVGATRANSYVDVDDKSVTFSFGPLFSRTFRRDEIAGAGQGRWPWWMGVGLRSNLRGVIGLIGSYRGVVEVRLKERSRAWAVFPCERIAISLEDPEGFIAALTPGAGAERPSSRPAETAGTARRPPRRRAKPQG